MPRAGQRNRRVSPVLGGMGQCGVSKLVERRPRRRVTVGLNKGEAKDALSRAVCFHRRGMVQDRTFDDQRLRAGELNLVVAAIVLWNTVYLERAAETLRAGGAVVPDELLCKTGETNSRFGRGFLFVRNLRGGCADAEAKRISSDPA